MEFYDLQREYKQSLALLKKVDKPLYMTFMSHLKKVSHENLSSLMACLKRELERQQRVEEGFCTEEEAAERHHNLWQTVVKGKNQYVTIGFLPETYTLFLTAKSKNIFGQEKNFSLFLSPETKEDLEMGIGEEAILTFASAVENTGKKESKYSTYGLRKMGRDFYYAFREETMQHREKGTFVDKFDEEETILTTPVVGY